MDPLEEAIEILIAGGIEELSNDLVSRLETNLGFEALMRGFTSPPRDLPRPRPGRTIMQNKPRITSDEVDALVQRLESRLDDLYNIIEN